MHLPDEAIADIRNDAAWPGRVAAAHTIVREGTIIDYKYDASRFSRLSLPTLLITGEETPPPLSAMTLQLDADLPNSRLAVLTGQGHMAIDSVPNAFSDLVIDFLLG